MMKKITPVVAVLVLGAVAGCQGIPALLTAPSRSALQPASSVAAKPAGWGSVSISVRWPRRVQSIPLAANSIVITAYNNVGSAVGTVTLTRSAASGTLGNAQLDLPAGQSYSFQAMAYAETSPTATSTPLAIGYTGVYAINSDINTPITLQLNASAPATGGLAASMAWYPIPAGGGVGAEFMVDAVQYLGRPITPSDNVQVWFGSTISSIPSVLASSSVQPQWYTDPVTALKLLVDADVDNLFVTVPSGLSGPVAIWVEVDGVKTQLGNNFVVVDHVVMPAQSVTRTVGESYDSTAGVGNLKGYSGADVNGTAIALSYPMLTWSSSAPSVAFVTNDGVVHANAPGQATITAQTGLASASFAFDVTDADSTASIDVNVPTLGAGDVNATMDIPAFSGDASGTVN